MQKMRVHLRRRRLYSNYKAGHHCKKNRQRRATGSSSRRGKNVVSFCSLPVPDPHDTRELLATTMRVSDPTLFKLAEGDSKTKARAVVRLKFQSEDHLSIVLKALKPETDKQLTSRSRVQIRGEGKALTLIFEARDTSALRAVTNSYLRWIALVNDTWSVMESLQ